MSSDFQEGHIYVKKKGDTMTGDLHLGIYNMSSAIITTTYINRIAGETVLHFGSDGRADRVTINSTKVIFPVQAPTATAPAYVKGGLYFDTTLDKLRVGGAAAWETVTSVA